MDGISYLLIASVTLYAIVTYRQRKNTTSPTMLAMYGAGDKLMQEESILSYQCQQQGGTPCLKFREMNGTSTLGSNLP